MPISTANPLIISLPVVKTTPIAAGTVANTVIKGSPGIFYGILVTSVGAGTPVVFDNATTNSGTPVGALGASAVIGLSGAIPDGVQCLNGITVAGGATNPAMTIYWN
jgi:hypothetical protein